MFLHVASISNMAKGIEIAFGANTLVDLLLTELIPDIEARMKHSFR